MDLHRRERRGKREGAKQRQAPGRLRRQHGGRRPAPTVYRERGIEPVVPGGSPPRFGHLYLEERGHRRRGIRHRHRVQSGAKRPRLCAHRRGRIVPLERRDQHLDSPHHAFPASQGNFSGGESIAPDPVNANIVYAAAGHVPGSGNGVILRSTDQGQTWAVNATNLPMGGNETGRGMGERLAVDSKNEFRLILGSRTAGLWKSVNSGAAWSQVTAFPTSGDNTYGLPVVVFDKRGGNSLGSDDDLRRGGLAATGSNLYRSTDRGATWTLVPGGPTGLMAHHASLGSDGTLWLAYSNDYGPYTDTNRVALVGQIWKLAGNTWKPMSTPTSNWGGWPAASAWIRKSRSARSSRPWIGTRRSPAAYGGRRRELERHRPAAGLVEHDL